MPKKVTVDPLAEATCRTCPFWFDDPSDRVNKGQCKFDPSPPIRVTLDTDWCGRHPVRAKAAQAG